MIVSVATGVYAAARATKTVPIVMVSAADVVAMGLVASLAHPGGNITGQTFLVPELIAKRLEFLKAAAPVDDTGGGPAASGQPGERKRHEPS